MKFKPLENSKSIQDLIDNLDSEILDYSTLTPDDIKHREFIIKSVLVDIRDRLKDIKHQIDDVRMLG